MLNWERRAAAAAAREVQEHAATPQSLPGSARINPIPTQVKGYPALGFPSLLIQALRDELTYGKIKANGAFSCQSEDSVHLKLALGLLFLQICFVLRAGARKELLAGCLSRAHSSELGAELARVLLPCCMSGRRNTAWAALLQPALQRAEAPVGGFLF